MDYHIVEARYVAGHAVWLRFRDGPGPLRADTFRQFRVQPEFHTLVWLNGADAPASDR